jgi:uncharacterized RDD family membrane protein YckC
MDGPTGSLRDQGTQALKEGNLDRAIDLLARAVMADDKDAEAKALLGIAYSQKGLHPQAKRALQTAVELQPQNANFRFNLGIAQERAGDIQGAAIAYRDTLQIDRTHAQALAKMQALGPQAHQLLANAPRPTEPVGVPTYTTPQDSSVPPPTGGPPMGGPPMGGPPMGGPPMGGPPMGGPPIGGPPAGGPPMGGGPLGAAPTAPPPLGGPPMGGPPMGGPPGLGGGLAPHSGPPGTIQCPSCGQSTRPGLTCEWCNTPLGGRRSGPTPVVTPAAPVYTPPAGLGYGVVPAGMSAGEAFFRRFAAVMIDGVLVSMVNWSVIFVVAMAMGAGSGKTPSDAQSGTFGAFYIFFPYLVLGIYSGVMYSLRGQTLGKMALGIRVVGPDDANPGFFRAAFRDTIGKIISSLFCAVGYLWMLWDGEQQTWHDKLFSTRVERV